jgi:hypothetical protein
MYCAILFKTFKLRYDMVATVVAHNLLKPMLGRPFILESRAKIMIPKS